MRHNRGGYTIIEVLIVLAVGTIIFFMAIALFAGKQGKTQFSQAMRDLESKMQSIVNDVGISLFPYPKGSRCITNGSEKPRFVNDSTADTGNNQDCVYLGKVVAIDTSTDPDKLVTYTVIGSRLDSRGNIISQINDSNFQDANPEPFSTNSGDSAVIKALTESYNLPSGTSLRSAKTDKDSGPSRTNMVGFYNSQQSAAQQGSLSLLTLGYTGFTSTDNLAQVKNRVEGNGGGGPDTIKSWALCIQSGTSDEMSKLVVSTTPAGISTNVVYGACT